jgi:hypothetical protein
MNCSEVHYYGPLYHSGELEEPFLQDFNQHLEACAGCEENIRREQATDQALRLASDEELDVARVREDIIANIHKEPARSAGYHISRWQAFGGFAAVVALTVLVWLTFRPVAHPLLTIYQDAADDHRTEVVEHLKLRWAQDDESILALLKTVGATEELTQQITPPGFHLDRARRCRLLKHSYVHLVYTDGHREVSYFLRARDGEELTGTPVTTVNGKSIYMDTISDLSVAGFQNRDVTVLMVSNESGQQVLDTIALAANKM